MNGPMSPRILTHPEEGRLFWQLRVRICIRLLKQWVQASTLRAGVLTLLTIGFWCGVYLIFHEGFSFLQSAIPQGSTLSRTIHAIFNLFFLSLLAMLILSSAIILYGSLYRNEEVTLLLTTPARPERIFLHKFQDTVFVSSWGFFLLGSPMLIAYGVASGAPWHYFALLLPFMLAFVMIPCGIGAGICLATMILLPKFRWHLIGLASILMLFWLALAGYALAGGQHEGMLTPNWFQNVLDRLRFCEQRLLPSWWLSSGLLEAASPHVSTSQDSPLQEALGFLCVLTANALTVPPLLSWIAKHWFVESYSRLRSLTPWRWRLSLSGIDYLVRIVLRPLPRTMRTLLVKDIRLFRRDPLHWSQFLIFFGLLALYFVNVPKFDYGESFQNWMTMVGFLNLGAVGLILSTFTTRFVYPMISMEGQRFWILATLPVRRDSVLWSKFLLALSVTMVPSSILVYVSDWMLRITERHPEMVWIHQAISLILCSGLSALSVGLGARLPNLSESSPARITAGFGGTLNLVLSAIFIVVTVTAPAMPSYYYLCEPLPITRPYTLDAFRLGTWNAVLAGTFVAGLMGTVTTAIPMIMGIRGFRRLEF